MDDNGAIMLVLVLVLGLFLAVVRYRGSSRIAWLLGTRKVCGVLLGAATLMVLVTTLYGSTSPTGRVNLVPGATIVAVFGHDPGNAFDNLLGNVLLFVPLGFLGVLALRRRVAAVTAVACGLSVVIEVSQFLLGHRWADIDDVLLNTTGAFLGALAATITSPRSSGPARAEVDADQPAPGDHRPEEPLHQGTGRPGPATVGRGLRALLVPRLRA